ncbi:hypothetical protein ROZALSC1DRAFT_26159, partial [Rozella allomycis CSF55]
SSQAKLGVKGIRFTLQYPCQQMSLQENFERWLAPKNQKLLHKLRNTKDEDGDIITYENYNGWSDGVWMQILGPISGGTIHAKLKEFKETIPMEIDQQNGPRGEQVDLSNPRALLNFMNMQMIDVTKLFGSCRILPEDKRNIELSGREEAIAQAADKFKMFANPVGKSKVELKIPVASGLSGLGKTRLMEEFERILDLA